MTRTCTAAALVLAAAGCATQPTEAEMARNREIGSLRLRNSELEREVAQLRASLGRLTAAKAVANPSANAYATAKDWVADATQIADAAKRDAAIATIRDALAGDDPALAAAGLAAVPQIAQVAYDRSTMRELVLRHATSEDASVRAAFPFALLNAGTPQPGDVDLVMVLTTDAVPLVRDNAGRSLVFFTKYDLTGPAGERVLALLDDPERQVRRDVLASVWGSKVSPGLEAKLLAMFASDDHQVRHDAFYFGLSTLKDKSPAVVDACIAAMESNDSELQWRARWGLGLGVPEDQRGKVSDAYVRLLSARSDTQLEQDAFRWLSHHGTVAHADELEKLAKNPLVAEPTKAAALATAATIRGTR